MKVLTVIIGIIFITGGGFISIRNDLITIRPAPSIIIDTLATGLTVPWEINFLPDKTMIFTERNGKVRLYRNEQLLPKPALILRETDTTKKMGLLSICVHPFFARNKYVYVSYNYRKDGNALLKIVRYEFTRDTLISPKTIIEGIAASPNHTGSRLKLGPDGKFYITTGDADRPILSQDLKSLNGKILRVNDDGTIPSDNPFIKNDTARKEIWSYGHRNTQGIDFQPGTNVLFNSEHGPNGGDEINIITKGGNYGWPVIHHQETKVGMISPLLEYSPSVGPSQILFYNAAAFPSLKGALLLATLRGEKLIQLRLQGGKIVSQENLIEGTYGRIRALTQGPDGFIYFSTSQNDPPEGKPRHQYDMLLRMRPSGLTDPNNAITRVQRGGKHTVNRRKSPSSLYTQLCANCHGINLEGSERARSMAGGALQYGSDRKNIVASIEKGIIEKGMPAWEGTLTKKEIESLADFLLVKRNKN